jgi:hypothetical protein
MVTGRSEAAKGCHKTSDCESSATRVSGVPDRISSTPDGETPADPEVGFVALDIIPARAKRPKQSSVHETG